MLSVILTNYLNNPEEDDARHRGACVSVSEGLKASKCSTSLQLHEVGLLEEATRFWVASTAVPSSTSVVFPVAHPCKHEATAYKEAFFQWSMLKGEYGSNRIQFAEFVRDYAEEYWK